MAPRRPLFLGPCRLGCFSRGSVVNMRLFKSGACAAKPCSASAVAARGCVPELTCCAAEPRREPNLELPKQLESQAGLGASLPQPRVRVYWQSWGLPCYRPGLGSVSRAGGGQAVIRVELVSSSSPRWLGSRQGH